MPKARLPKRSQQPDQLRLLWKIVGIAFMMSSEVAAGALIGWLIDRWQGTPGRWLTIGGIVGIVVGMASLFRATWKLSRSPEFRSGLTRKPAMPLPDRASEDEPVEWMNDGDDDDDSPRRD